MRVKEMKTNCIKNNLIIKLTGIVAVCTAVIAGFYSWLIPKFFTGFATYSVFVIGVCSAAVLGIICCVKADRTIIEKKYGYLILIFTGVVVAALVMFFSLLIILNTRGS